MLDLAVFDAASLSNTLLGDAWVCVQLFLLGWEQVVVWLTVGL